MKDISLIVHESVKFYLMALMILIGGNKTPDYNFDLEYLLTHSNVIEPTDKSIKKCTSILVQMETLLAHHRRTCN